MQDPRVTIPFRTSTRYIFHSIEQQIHETTDQFLTEIT